MPIDASAVSIDLEGARQQFQQQIDFFLQKLNLPTQRWDDIKTRANDRAFYVAGAQKADLLADLRAAVDKSVNGQSIDQFRKDFAAAVAKSGWSGWTGQGTKAGEAWRTRIIYQTNIATSYAAGRWTQLNDPDLVSARPFWRYVHSDSVLSPRPQHKAWGDSGLTLPREHPFWKTHFPPNGWGCQCRVVAARAPKSGDATSPPDGRDAIDAKTGAPVGIDKGWGYAPGANVDASFRSLIDDKLINLDASIGALMAQTLEPVLQVERLDLWQLLFDRTRQNMQSVGDAVLVHTVSPQTVKALSSRGITLENAAVWARDEELLHALRGSKSDRGAALPDEFLRDLPNLLNEADVYYDSDPKSAALIYVFDTGDKLGKIPVRVNYNEKLRINGQRERFVSNFVATGGLVGSEQILKDARFEKLAK